MRALLYLMLPVPLLLQGGGPVDDGVRAYREGRFQAALRAFEEAEQAAGEGASAELLHNQAMAALRAGELVRAEYTAEKAVARGGAGFAPWRDFVYGSTAFVRCLKAEEEALKPDAALSVFDRAVEHAGTACLFWQRAAASRANWPEARRNVERALLKLEGLKKRREAAAELRKQANEKKKIEIRIDPTIPADPDTRQLASKVKPLLDELAPDLVRRIIEKLREKEKEKAALRKARQQLKTSEVEKNW